MSRDGSTPAQQAMYKAALSKALKAGYNILHTGGEAMDAVVAAVTVLEDCPLFNAGKGAVFNVGGKNELESSLMLSKPPCPPAIPTSRRGIGLTLLTRTRNPSHLARRLYLSPSLVPHAYLSGANADHLAETLGEDVVDPSYFFTENRWREHRRGLGLPEEPLPPGHAPESDNTPDLDQMPAGTVGAVALDIRGCIAVLTSTGGRTNKLVGRIGDTPLMGAGFWAEEWQVKGWLRETWDRLVGRSRKTAVGVSGTGDGDYFIRLSTASSIARRVQHLGEPLQKAAETAIQDLFRDGGMGGVIALDGKGNVAMPLNCPGMYRGVIRADGVPMTAIFADDELE